MGNNDILNLPGESGTAANVICRDCVVPAISCSGGQPTPEGLKQAIGQGSNSDIVGNIYITNPILPPVPTPPTNTVCSSTGSACRINLGSPLNLPRAIDLLTHNPGTPYHYVMTDIPLKNSTITIDTTISPVYLYVSGDITVGGGGGFSHAGSPERFAIFGNPADPTNATPDQTFTISGGSSASRLFIYAPDARVGINGGSNDPDILGSAWIKTWDSSSSNNADIKTPDNMRKLVVDAFGPTFDIGVKINQISNSTSWQRMEAK